MKGNINLSIKIVMVLAITLTIGFTACKLAGPDNTPDTDGSGPATVYAATLGRLSISTDGGVSFTNRTTLEGLGYNYVYGVYVVP